MVASTPMSSGTKIGRSFQSLLPALLVCVLAVEASAFDFNGQLTTRGTLSDLESDHMLSHGNSETCLDGSADLRLMTQFSSGPTSFDLHYEISALGGDLFQKEQNFQSLLPGLFPSNPESSNVFNLKQDLSAGSRGRLQHRLDRLSFRFSENWGNITLGRDVVTWGNGLVFNPLDLLNPFAPQDIERDYKVGEELLLLDIYPDSWNGNAEWQLLAVPHRDPVSGDIEKGQTSLAAKTHFFIRGSEWDIMLATHYDEPHVGIGSVHTIGSAVARADWLIGTPTDGPLRHSIIVNADYSWTWGGLNTYGFLEFAYQSVGVKTIDQAFTKPALLERIARGEVYTYGQHYLAAGLQVELHPLVNLYLSTIVNLDDASAYWQPRLSWDAGQNLQILIGASIATGDTHSEFGGFEIPGSDRIWKSPNSINLRVKCFF